jgi:hypothetical protein
MKDAITFFQQYESVIYFFLALGIVYYSWHFYSAWQELRGSVFGLEQIGAQRRLNRSALAIFFMLVLGFGVFSVVAFALPIMDTDIGNIGSETDAELVLGTNNGEAPDSMNTIDSFATATPLPTVVVNPEDCDIERIAITSPLPNEEVRGVVEIKGIVNVEDFGFYIFEIARAEEELWLPIQAARSLVLEESTLLEWDSSLFPPGSYVIQLIVTKNDGEEYSPCRIPIRIGN